MAKCWKHIDLELHKLSHGPKRYVPRGGEDGEEDVEDVGEDDIMDDVLEDEENVARKDDETLISKGVASYDDGED